MCLMDHLTAAAKDRYQSGMVVRGVVSLSTPPTFETPGHIIAQIGNVTRISNNPRLEKKKRHTERHLHKDRACS